MQNVTSSHSSQCMELNLSSINIFWEKFNVKTILNRSSIRKLRGVHPIVILTYIFALPFIGKNFYHGIVQNPHTRFKKDASYSACQLGLSACSAWVSETGILLFFLDKLRKIQPNYLI